jgi:hypothetical protein
MPNVATRLWSQQEVRICSHTSVSGSTWQLVKKGTATSNGAAGGTTVIDTNGDSGGADTYNGRYWVHILSGSAKGEWSRVVDDDGSGTLTLEDTGFSAQIDSGVEYEIWLSPDPVVVVDSSSGETNMVDAVRAESDDYWNGYWAIPITGAHRGKRAQVSDFASSGGTFTLGASFGSALTAGDVVLLRKFVEVSNFNDGTDEAYVPRPMGRLNFAKGDGVPGPRGGSVSFNTQVVASGSLSGTGAKAGASVVSPLLMACGLEETVQTSCTVGAGSSTSAVKIATGSWENLSVGGAVIWNGDLRFISSLEDGGGAVDTVNVTPAFPTAPANADVLYATRMYAKSTDGDTDSVLVEWEVDGVRHTFTGCMGSVTLNDGPVLEFAFSLNVDHYIREVKAAPYIAGAVYTTAAAIKSSDRIAYLDTTATDIGGFTCSPNTTASPKAVQGSSGINGRAGYHVTDYNCGGTFRELVSSSGELTQELRWTARTAKAVAVIYGSHGNTMAVRMPVARLVQSPKPTNDNGMVAAPNVLEAQDAGTATDGGSTIRKVPDFAIHLA